MEETIIVYSRFSVLVVAGVISTCFLLCHVPTANPDSPVAFPSMPDALTNPADTWTVNAPRD